MSLLREVLENPLDVGYYHGAEHAPPSSALPGWQRVLVVLACAVIAAGAVWSARALRLPEDGVSTARQLLVQEIDQRRSEGDALQSANGERALEAERLRAASLDGVDATTRERLESLGVVAGVARVRGPGIVVRLTDSRAAQEGVPGTEDERVQDVDLQVLVNGLWQAGAEAIAINGYRLSATSAIRAAGQTVFVNLSPVVSPYTVEAVGDPGALQTAFARTAAAEHLRVLRSVYDIDASITRADELTLPGNQARTLRWAEVAASAAATPGEPGDAGAPPEASGAPPMHLTGSDPMMEWSERAGSPVARIGEVV
ncbi:MAG: DUF881 domain-containing protein [Georgenia sp.]